MEKLRLTSKLRLASIAVIFIFISYKMISTELHERAQIQKSEELESLRREVSQSISKQLRNDKTLDKDFYNKSKEVHLEFTFNKDLEKYIKRILKRYRSDYSSVVVIDNNTGKILSAIGYKRKNNEFDLYQPFSSSHPSASVFKIITSAALLETKSVIPDTKFSYKGKGTTLYKHQLNNKKSRWSRKQKFKHAFAYSNNVIFGKAAINEINGVDLYNMAKGFGFNQELVEEASFTRSIFHMPESQYQLAEFASGFNKKTLMSPVHGAAIASIVARGGDFIKPSLIDKVFVDGKDIWRKAPKAKQVIDSSTAQDIRQMMELAVKNGTARGSFRRLPRVMRNNLDIGGKTGSITGGVPFGKRDWFTAYAKPKYIKGKGISICVMNVNVDKWYVKSAFLARKILEFYYKKIDPINKVIVKRKLLKERENV